MIIVCGVLLIIFLVWKPFSKTKTVSESEVVAAEVVPHDKQENELKSPETSSPATAEQNNSEIENAISPELQQKNFSEALSQITHCLGLKSIENSGRSMPTETEMLDLLKPDLTEPVIQSSDWQMTSLVTADGEERKIKMETDYTNDEDVTQVLKYYRVEKDKSLTQIPLPPEQTQDPSDTFIASLEKDGNVSAREKASRYYFQSGEELLITDKNGLIQNFEMSRQGRTVKCQNLSVNNSTCGCQ